MIKGMGLKKLEKYGSGILSACRPKDRRGGAASAMWSGSLPGKATNRPGTKSWGSVGACFY